MNPHSLSASDLLVWGIVLHLVADWPFQSDWMAQNKMKRANLGKVPGDGMTTAPSRMHPYSLWFIRHPAAYVHAGIHGLFLAIIFGWVAIPLAVLHLIIDTRVPVVWWGRLIHQVEPANQTIFQRWNVSDEIKEIPVYDMGMEVRIWVDQVFHIICIAVAALLVA
jgi:hypothetical protein